jgi:peptide/nickel transport system substrate-binding protein
MRVGADWSPMRSTAAVILVLLAAVVLPACGSSGSATTSGSKAAAAKAAKLVSAVNLDCKGVKLGGTVTVGVSQDAFSFDPPYTQDNGSLWADMNIYDQLVRLTPNATKLVPGLATSWKITNGGKTYVFHLRNAKFSNGDPVTAQDVAFSLQRAASPKAFANVGLSIISSTKVINAHTIQVNTKTVSAPFLNDLALWPASVLDEKAFKKEGESVFKDHPVGSGPFSVVSFKPGNEIVLKKNPYWWDTDTCGNHYPYLNQVVLKYIPNDNTRVTALQGGQLDGIFNVPYNEVASLNSGDVTSTVTPQLGVDLLALSQNVPAFRNPDVIQAINYALDRPAIVKSVFSGNALPAQSPLFPGIDFSTKRYGYPYNVTKAKALMAASGVKSFAATLTIPAGNAIAAEIAQIFQSEMSAIGGKISIAQEDSTTLQNAQSKGKLQISWTALTSDVLDPSENALFCCVSNGGANSNYTGWKDPAADALYQQAQVTLNQARRRQLYDQWQKVIMRKAPLIWIVNPSNTFAYQKDVHDFFLQPTAHYPLWVAWKGS